MKFSPNRPSRVSALLVIGVLLLLAFFQFLGEKPVFGLSLDSKMPNSVLEKQKGAHVFGIYDTTDFDFLTRNNIEWITLVPWAFQTDYNSTNLGHNNGDSVMTRKSNASWVRRVEHIRSAGFKVFVKPHVWLNEPTAGTWRSDIFLDNEEEWTLWKEKYRDFILRYAHLAQQGEAEMFCIGTELSRLSVEKPLFWSELIREVRGIYAGKITYAANWYNEYEKITFWEELDYIGLQAYFSLVENDYPSLEQISAGWSKYVPNLEFMQRKYNRNILFTEMGYKSTANSASKPWEWVENSPEQYWALSNETQAHAYQAFFNTIWDKPWFAGVHIWQLRSDYRIRRNIAFDFTPQGKPAEAIMAKGFE